MRLVQTQRRLGVCVVAQSVNSYKNHGDLSRISFMLFSTSKHLHPSFLTFPISISIPTLISHHFLERHGQLAHTLVQLGKPAHQPVFQEAKEPQEMASCHVFPYRNIHESHIFNYTDVYHEGLACICESLLATEEQHCHLVVCQRIPVLFPRR